MSDTEKQPMGKFRYPTAGLSEGQLSRVAEAYRELRRTFGGTKDGGEG